MDAAKIRDLRIRLEWTQAEMAAHLGVSQPTVWRMECGQKITGPTGKLLEQLLQENPLTTSEHPR